MKKILFLLSFVFSALGFAQTNEEVARNSEPLQQLGDNEFKVNILYTALGVPELTYERLLNDNSGLGLSMGFAVEGPEDMEYRFGVTPYYRMYFGYKKASGFFIEANAASITYVDQYMYDTNETQTQTSFGLGAAVGGKFLSRNGLIGEVYAGLGRLFGDSSLGAYPRFGISLGKRF